MNRIVTVSDVDDVSRIYQSYLRRSKVIKEQSITFNLKNKLGKQLKEQIVTRSKGTTAKPRRNRRNMK